MGFKRTTEGRVYFEGDEEAPVARPVDYRSLAKGAQNTAQSPSQGAQGGQSGQDTQSQILTPLKALNDKLKVSQAERAHMRSELDGYKKAIENLATRSDNGSGTRAEKMAADTLKELHETRKLLLELEDKADKTDKTAAQLQRQM